jgi:hypothetical protein
MDGLARTRWADNQTKLVDKRSFYSYRGVILCRGSHGTRGSMVLVNCERVKKENTLTI